MLNCCKTSLDQGRFTWRPDSILKYLATELNKRKPENTILYIDIPGHKINGGTIPADILTTLERPDIVILNRQEKKITLFELTVSFEIKH